VTVVSSDDPLLAYGIDAREIEAITLAGQHAAEWVLIDNAHARRAARAVGLCAPARASQAAMTMPP
jgi:predicted nucleic acid-binding protein